MTEVREQGPAATTTWPGANHNALRPEDRPVHDWYRFILSFPAHLVRDCVQYMNIDRSARVLDPFCGTGTTLVECKKIGLESTGIEANPVAAFASRVKVDWTPSPGELWAHASQVADRAREVLRAQDIEDDPLFLTGRNGRGPLLSLPPEKARLLLSNSISPLPLHKTLVLLRCLQQARDDRFHDHELLALAKSLVYGVSNLRFGPEVGLGTVRPDAPVIARWLDAIRAMAADLQAVVDAPPARSTVHRGDARALGHLEAGSVGAVITSPPYPNEKDYTRTTRLESVVLGFINSRKELRDFKKELVRSNTRGVYKEDDDDAWVRDHPEIQAIARAIEERRRQLGKTSGFERLYARVAKLYFGGMLRHLAELRRVLRPGARLAYVVGDQASYLRIMIRTGQLLADIAESLGYEVMGIELFRTRLATATREQLREEIVVLGWPGS